MFAALGSAVASGHELAVQLAVSLPAVLVAGPVAVGRAAECAADAAVAAVIGESAEWEDIVAAWCEGFISSKQPRRASVAAQHCPCSKLSCRLN